MAKDTTIIGYKGFDKDLKCRDFQYGVGEKYKHNGVVSCCDSGFHLCEHPLDVFGYYPPADSRFCEIAGYGDIDRCGVDSKVAVSRLKIKCEIGLRGMIEAGVKFIMERVDWKNTKATNTGNRSAATNTGNRSAASVSGLESIACGLGYKNKARGSIGCWIVLSEWSSENGKYHIKNVKSRKVDGKIIKADTWYTLENNKFIETD